MSDFDKYRLQKWAEAVKKRDGYTCFMCEEIYRGYWIIEAHHIEPKAVNPQKAYDLSNGVCLCGDCHDVVHNTKNNWKKFSYIFKRYNKRKKVREFNEKNQGDI
jgi:predicted HNH restriction endonuclease